MTTATSARPGNYFRWFARRKHEVCGGFIRSEESYQRLLTNLSTWDIYLGLNPANTFLGTKVRDIDITEVIGLVIDVDPQPGLLYPASQAEACEEPILAAVERVLGRIPSSTVMFTGRGLQVWLRVQYDILTPSNRPIWRSAIKRFTREIAQAFSHDRFVIDTSCTDLSRLVRAPGSTNQKTGALVTAISTHSYPAIQPNSFLDRFFIPESPESAPAVLRPNERWWKIFHTLTNRAQVFLTEGVSEPGRHAAAYATAASLRDSGVSFSVAEGLITRAARLCTPPLPQEEAARAARNAYISPVGGPSATRTSHAHINT